MQHFVVQRFVVQTFCRADSLSCYILDFGKKRVTVPSRFQVQLLHLRRPVGVFSRDQLVSPRLCHLPADPSLLQSSQLGLLANTDRGDFVCCPSNTHRSGKTKKNFDEVDFLREDKEEMFNGIKDC
jgi:hypothetical protein